MNRPFHLEHPGNCLEKLTRCSVGCNRSSLESASIASIAIAAGAIDSDCRTTGAAEDSMRSCRIENRSWARTTVVNARTSFWERYGRGSVNRDHRRWICDMRHPCKGASYVCVFCSCHFRTCPRIGDPVSKSCPSVLRHPPAVS